MKKKLTTELTDDELLKLLNTEENVFEAKTVVIQNNYHKILDFISKYNIKAGNHEVTSKILYELFRVEYPDISFNTFVNRVKRLLPYKRPRNIVIFYVDKTSLDITDRTKQHYFTSKSKILRYRNLRRHVEGFMKYFNIKPGNNAINTKIVYDLYDRWAYKFKKKKVNNQTLSTILKMYLEFYKHSNNTDRYFKMSDDIFKVISERQLKNLGKKHREKQKEES